jgi:hypothetical protein
MNDDYDNRKDDDAILARLKATEDEHVRLTADSEPKGCFFIPAKPWEDTGKWVPSWVTRDQPGHTPFAGNPAKLQQPWFWGRTYLEAQETASRENAKLGISPAQAAAIILSSVRASRHAGQERAYTGRDAFGPAEES